MSRSIKARLAGFVVVMITASMLCQVIFNVSISKKVFLYEKKSQVEQLYHQLEKNYSDDQDKLWSIVSEAQNVQNILILITSDEGVIYSNPPPFDGRRGPGGGDGGDDSGGSLEVHTKEPTLKVFSSPREDGQQMIHMTGTIYFQGEARYILLATSVQAINDSIALFTKTNILISIGVMILGSLGVVLFARKLSRPIQNIEAVARRVSELDFDAEADENSGITELARLAGSINVMARRLEGMIGDLSSANEKLKDKVDDQEKLEQMRKEFIANVSHEMKTPLSMLMLYSESLKGDIPGIDRDYYLETIMEEAERLNDMVMQLLDISSLENGLSQIELAPLDFSEFADSVTEKTEVLLQSFRASRRIEKGIWINGDQKYLERAIRNYIMNASSHGIEGGEIRIGLERRDGSAVFSVFNEGEHIAEADMERIWDSFYRADQARTQTETHRVGLGLYIVKTILQSHQGSYGVRNVENGVEFWFSIPCR